MNKTTGCKGNILIIDDTPENLTLLAEMLKQEGYKVRSATKGSTALRGAQAAPPDVILLDVNMPEMNGYQVCQQLKADDRTRDIPVIFISALGDVIDKVKAFQVGGVDYITKPFQLEEVQARICTHLTLCRLRQELQTQNVRLQGEIRERQQAEDKFAKVFRTSPHPIAISRSDGRFIDVNPAFLQLTGYSQSEIRTLTLADLHLDLTADRAQPEQLAVYANASFPNANSELQAIASPQHVHSPAHSLTHSPIYNQECELQAKSGERRIVLLSLEAIELEGIPCTLNLVNDITQRKRLENEFISIVSHELRTPLASLMGALDVLGTGQFGELNEQGQNILQIALTSTERLTRLVNDILDLERLKFGKLTLQPKECSLDQVMLQAIAAMQAMADQAKVQLQVQPLSVKLWADSDRLIQALTNLLSNAIKFSPPGETVWLNAQLLPSPLHPSTQLLLAVCDRGRGIPPDKLELIFDRFQQVDTSDARLKGGTGLGLAICRSIVEQHDGKIWAESTLGQGSTFFIALPIGGGQERYTEIQPVG